MHESQLFQRAMKANGAGRHLRALQLCNVALSSERGAGDAAALHLERARAFLALGDATSAERECRRAIAREPSTAAFASLARCLREQQRFDEAAALLEPVLDDPDAGAASLELATRVFLAQRRNAEALIAARRARARDVGRASLLALVDALAANGEARELIALLESELEVSSNDAKLWTALGLAHYADDDAERAKRALRRAVALDPHCVDAHCGLGWALLRSGDFAEGFAHQEYRLTNAGDQRRFGVDPWRRQSLVGKHVLLCAEQGFGDIIQFARFVPRVRRLAAQTTFVVPPALARLFTNSPELGPIDVRHPAFGGADAQTLLMSLPHLLDSGADLELAALPCLHPESSRVAAWRARLPKEPKIALAWQGNPKYGGEPWRSMPVSEFAPLVDRFGRRATFISLQKHVGREQLRAAPFAAQVLDLGDEIDEGGEAFVDTLAILSLVDRLITTDSAIAHVAGSAGIEAWVLLSRAADWRWGRNGDRTPWYPSLRLFRQRAAGDWNGVVAGVIAALEATWICAA